MKKSKQKISAYKNILSIQDDFFVAGYLSVKLFIQLHVIIGYSNVNVPRILKFSKHSQSKKLH